MNKFIRSEAFINGEFYTSKHTFNLYNPATGEIISPIADLSVQECEETLEIAEKAGQSWKDKPATERAQILKAWYSLVLKNKKELAELMTIESGKSLTDSLTEVDYGNSFIEWFAEEARRAYGETIPSASSTLRLLTIQQPVGLVAAITPWNFPLAMVTRKVAPALAAGCTVVLKPASQTPLTAIALAQLAAEAGVPAGVFNVIPSSQAAAIGSCLASSDRVRKISFTGSTGVGKTLMQQAASTVKKVSMELGGNAPFIVFEDADIDAAVQGAMAGKFRNSGQTCVSINRFYIHEQVYAEFSEKIATAVKALKIGNGLDKGVQIGPLINQKGLDKVQAHVQDAVDKGADIQAGGKHIQGLFFEPTVLSNVPDHALIAKEETFGPVCALFSFKTEEEVLQKANQTEFGLAAYFYSQNMARCIRVSEQLEAGMVGVNTGLISNAAAPFGGVKESGVGREGSAHGLSEYMELKYICLGI